MKRLKKQLKQHISSLLLDIGQCCLYKVHNTFGHVLSDLGGDKEETFFGFLQLLQKLVITE